jgi:cyclopropane fatty-acyl-phospholipid synthase-like methyltransferase
MRQFGRPSGPLGRLAGLVMEWRPSNRERNRRTLELLELGPGDRVLEIGFGPGLAVKWAARRARFVAGIDHSETMLKRAVRRNARAIARGGVELRRASAEDWSDPRASFDKAFAVNVYMFWKQPTAVFHAIAGALRPGGTVAITHQPRQAGATNQGTSRAADLIAGHLREAGFERVRVQLLPMKPVNAVCVLGHKPGDGVRLGSGRVPE